MGDRSLKLSVRPDELEAGPPTLGAAAMRPPITCPAEATVGEAARIMADRRVGAVVLEGPTPTILTERDVLFAAAAGDVQEPARSYAAAEPVIADAATSFDAAATVMATEGVRHLLVAEGGEVVGVFSVRDLIAHQVLAAEAEDPTAERRSDGIRIVA